MFVISLSIGLNSTAYGYSDGDRIEYESDYVGHSRVFKDESGKYIGCCCQPGVDPKDSGRAVLDKDDVTAKLRKVAYYYGYQKGWTENTEIVTGFQTHDYAARFMYMVQMCQVGKQAWLNWANSHDIGNNVQRDAEDLYDGIDNLDVSVPASFEVWIANPTDGSQNFMLYYMNETGQLKLKKSSANTSITKK